MFDGGRIRLLREMVKPPLGNRELDRLAVLKPGHSWLLENGFRLNPTSVTLDKLAVAFGVSLGFMLHGEGTRPKSSMVSARINALRAKAAGNGKAA